MPLPLLALVILAGLQACSAMPQPRPVHLGFLDGAHITRQQVQEQLGLPGATFESGQVITYRLTETRTGTAVVTSRRPD
jgi:hypothetical protein